MGSKERKREGFSFNEVPLNLTSPQSQLRYGLVTLSPKNYRGDQGNILILPIKTIVAFKSLIWNKPQMAQNHK